MGEERRRPRTPRTVCLAGHTGSPASLAWALSHTVLTAGVEERTTRTAYRSPRPPRRLGLCPPLACRRRGRGCTAPLRAWRSDVTAFLRWTERTVPRPGERAPRPGRPRLPDHDQHPSL
ncbi:SsgA family sporulation/cell division regulator [Streptomyces sp. NBC_00572]|uniref:SsgA family sporulation/cell division regulator n=1 Tax=Streptomyces sp. NBC_00572 TaxID=2903664 RepID=UPI00338DFACA